MSLLVINSASRISQGIIRQLHSSGKYENIVCADLFPNYWGVQRQVDFLYSVDKNASKTKLVDAQISDKQDLEQLISKATHVVYVNHDYYSNVASKTNLINTASKIVQNNKQNIKSFVAVNPTEHDHMGEPQPFGTSAQAQKQAQQASEQLVNIQSDVTFGADATVLKVLTGNLLYGRNITFQPSSQRPAPIHVNCLAHGVQNALEQGDKLAGKTFSAEGPNKYSWQQILSTLERVTGAHAQQGSKLEYAVSPLSNNILSEFFHQDTYRNAVQYINNYQNLTTEGTSPITELGVKPLDFEVYNKDRKIPRVESNERTDQSEQTIKNFVY